MGQIIVKAKNFGVKTTTDEIEELASKIEFANQEYRLGTPIMSDLQYDELVEELKNKNRNHPTLSKIGISVESESRKSKLPIQMASMDKVKTLDDIKNWFRLKGLPNTTTLVLTPKYDGLSLVVDEEVDDCWTRGDGEYGQKSNEHYGLIENKLYQPFVKYTYGEVIMPKDVFVKKYSNDFANPRNFVAGLLNSDDIRPALTDCVYVKYGSVGGNFRMKSEMLSELNRYQDIEVPFHLVKLPMLTEEKLKELFDEWSKEFEIDGIIVEIDDLKLQESMGRETSGNPSYARAYKSPAFETEAESEVLNVEWNISKQGYLKPILKIKPVKLDGVTVSNITGNNARFVKEMGIGKGSIIKLKRSGMVIPLVTEVVKKVDFQMPDLGTEIKWNDNGVELVTVGETDDQKFKKIVSFFETLEVENCGEGVLKQLWDAGHRSVKEILSLEESDLTKLEGFGKRKASIVYKSIHSKMKDVQLHKLMHASGTFGNSLGSKKLALLTHFKEKPTVSQVMGVEGFAEKTATAFVEGWDNFWSFIDGLPITIQTEVVVEKSSNELEGTNFVFTGVRSKEAEEIIVKNGGKIGSSVSKNTTHLVMKAKGSGSSKENKALELGVKILTLDELNKWLGSL